MPPTSPWRGRWVSPSALYKESQGGCCSLGRNSKPNADKTGHYTAMLGFDHEPRTTCGHICFRRSSLVGCASARRSRAATDCADERSLRSESFGCGDHRRQTALRTATGSAWWWFRFFQSNNAPTPTPLLVRLRPRASQTTFPLFASNGGAAKVKDSIITESGSTLSVAGSASLTGPISASATSGSSAAVVGYDNTSGGSAGVNGTSTNGTGVVATGITGLLGTGAGEDGVGVYCQR